MFSASEILLKIRHVS